MLATPNFSPTDAARFIAALTGKDYRTTPVVLQILDDNEERRKARADRKDLVRVCRGTLPDVWGPATELNKRGAGVFIQINEGDRGNKKVTALRALFIDDDGGHKVKEADGTLAFVPSPTPKIKLPASAIVERGGNPRRRHYYWFLKPGESIERFSYAQRHLAAYYQTDKSVTNLDRVMRLPGTIHLKDPAAPQAVKLVSLEPSRHYTIDEVLAAHPLDKSVIDELTKGGKGEKGEKAEPEEEATPAARSIAEKVKTWLDDQRVAYETSDNGIAFILTKCPLNPEHKDARIKVLKNGAIFAGCFHDSCGGNTQKWVQFKEAIGGWGSGDSFSRGDHTEMVRRVLSDAGADSSEPIVFADGEFYRYSDEHGVWETITVTKLSKLILDYGGASLGKSYLALKNSDRAGVIEWATKIAGQPEFFINAPYGVAFQNGFLTFADTPKHDLADGDRNRTPPPVEFREHCAANRARAQLPYPYDPNLKPKRWLKFLYECFAPDDDPDDKIAVLQEFIGTCLLGDACRYQSAVILYGPKAENGKSVFIDTMISLFPKRLVSHVKPQDFQDEKRRAMLAGVHLNAVNELPENEIMSADYFKEIIDGKTVDGRLLYKDVFIFAPRAGHLFSVNRLLGTVDYTRAFFRRWRVITWNRVFGEADRDRYLTETLAKELPAIAAWAVQGAIRLRQNGEYTMPASSKAAMDLWRRDVDSVAAFVASCTQGVDVGEEGVPAQVLLTTMREWIRESGHKPISNTTAVRRLENLGLFMIGEGDKACYPLKLTVAPAAIIWN